MRTPAEERRRGLGRVLRNGLSGVAARVAMMLVGFVLTPYIIVSLGMTNFGLLAIFGSLAGYLGLLDFGLGGTFVKFITEYAETDRYAAARQVVTFGTLFYLGFGLCATLPVFFSAPAIVHAFRMPMAEQPHAAWVLRAYFVLVAASMIVSVPGSIVTAKHRMDVATRNNVIGYAAYACATAVLLHAGWGINGLIAAQGLQTGITATLQYLTARRLFGPVFADPRRLDPTIIRRMFGFGGWTQATALLNVVIVDAGRFVTANLISVASVTYYEIGSKLAYVSKTLPNYLVDAVSPAAAAADAHDERELLRTFETTASLYLLLGTTLLAGFIAGACGPIVRVWMGEPYPAVVPITDFLCLAYVASSCAVVGTAVLRSVGRPDLEAACVGTGALVNVVSTVLAVRAAGIVGAGIGTCAGWIAYAACYEYLGRRRRDGAPVRSLALPAARIVGVGAVSATALEWLSTRAAIQPLFDHKVGGLFGLAACGVFYVTLFVALAWIGGAFSFDRDRVTRVALRLRRAGVFG